MTVHKKDEIPIPKEILYKYGMVGVTYRAFNYFENEAENQRIDVDVDYEKVLQEVKKPQALKLWEESGLDFSQIEELYNFLSDNIEKISKEKGIDITSDAKHLLKTFTFYMMRIYLNVNYIREELFGE